MSNNWLNPLSGHPTGETNKGFLLPVNLISLLTTDRKGNLMFCTFSKCLQCNMGIENMMPNFTSPRNMYVANSSPEKPSNQNNVGLSKNASRTCINLPCFHTWCANLSIMSNTVSYPLWVQDLNLCFLAAFCTCPIFISRSCHNKIYPYAPLNLHCAVKWANKNNLTLNHFSMHITHLVFFEWQCMRD